MRVLVVEDEIAIQQQLVDALQAVDFVVDVADNGEDALYYGREFPIDVAVVDLGLPKIDGVQVIKTLRAENKAFTILILTARSRWQECENLERYEEAVLETCPEEYLELCEEAVLENLLG